MKPTRVYLLHTIIYIGFAASFSLATDGEELSHARIVRLSFAEGGVSILRPDVEEWASGHVNTPLQEGFKVATDEGGFAEIEFENASTARIGQGTLLEFTQLALQPSGAKINRMSLVEGYASFMIIPEEGDVYEVTAGTATLTPHGKSLFRVDLDEGALQVKVFKGSVEIMSPEGNGTLGKNSVLFIRPEGEQPFEISYGIQKDAWDEWVEDREERVQMVRSMGVHRAFSGYSTNTSDLLWGAMDLMYFGTWITDPVYGYGWVPTVGPGWSPFTHGRWAWYRGFGYTWIGYEPWGWLPYHYGSWTYNPGIGWCWFPSGGFASWSPALVHWYQGNGWVGWSPRWAGGRDFHDHCPRSQGCVATTSNGTLTGGQVVNPDQIQWRSPFESGRPIDRVSLEPGSSAFLPGTARDRSRLPGRGTTVGGATATAPSDQAISVIGGERGGRQPAGPSGIAFDSASGRYVQNHEASPNTRGPTRTNSIDFARQHTQGGNAGGPRPAPANNYPVTPAAWGRQPGAAPRTDRSGGSSPTDNSDWIRSNAVGWGNPRSDRSSGSASSNESRGSTANSGRSTPSGNSSATSGSGSNSGGWGGSGSSGGNRGSSGSVGGNSGGWGGSRGSVGGGGGSLGGGSRGSMGGGGGGSMGGRPPSGGGSGGAGARAPR